MIEVCSFKSIKALTGARRTSAVGSVTYTLPAQVSVALRS
jgi:hypothetical protein